MATGSITAHTTSDTTTPGTRGPVAFWLVTAATALALAASGTPSPLYVDYQAQWHFSATTLTAVYAIYAGGVIVALLLLGGLSDRVGRRPVMLASIAALIASMMLFVFADGTGWLYAARAVQGLATGVFTGAAGAALSELHPRRDHRIASLVNSTATSSGIAFGAVTSGALAEWVSYPLVVPYVSLSVASLVVLVLLTFKVPETVTGRRALRHNRVHVRRQSLVGVQRLSPFRVQRLGVPYATRGEFLSGSLSVLAAWSVGGLYLALGGTLANLLLHVNNHVIAGLVILSVQGVGGATQLVWSLARPNASNRSAAVVGCSALIAGMGVVAVSLASSSTTVFFAGTTASGVGFGLAFMSGTRRVTHAAPDDKRGEVMAAYFLVAYIAISLPVIIAGFVATHLGVIHTFYLFAAVMSAVTVGTLVANVHPAEQDPVGHSVPSRPRG